MTANQGTRLNKDTGCYLNNQRSIKNGIERLLSGGKPTRSRSVLKGESSLAFDRRKRTGARITRTDNRKCLSPARVAQRDGNQNRRIQVDESNYFSSRSRTIRPIAGEASDARGLSFSWESGRGLGPGWTRPAAIRRS